jgi:hypothetical protein
MSSIIPLVTSSQYIPTVITGLTITFESTTFPLHFNSTLETKDWYRIEKDLYLHTLAGQSAWLDVAHAKEDDLTASHLVVTDVRIGKPPSSTDGIDEWESRLAGLWVRRSNYNRDIRDVVTGIDILFGVDAIDPRLQWNLFREPFLLKDASPRIPIARLTIRRGWPKQRSERPTLKVREDGSFRIVQISDTHMVTGVGSCKDTIDANGRPLPEGEADPLTVTFMEAILDVEKPDSSFLPEISCTMTSSTAKLLFSKSSLQLLRAPFRGQPSSATMTARANLPYHVSRLPVHSICLFAI